MLNPKSPIPLYYQLAEHLEEEIRSGNYSPGERIPPETTLAADLGIGRPTVRQAIDQLVRKGRLIRKRGSGTYVQPGIAEVDLFSLGGTLAAFHEKGIELQTRMVETIRRIYVNADAENPFSESEAFFLKRLTLVESSPVLLEEIYLHPETFKGLDGVDLSGSSLSAAVSDRYGMRPTGGRQVFTIGYLDRERAALLDVTTDAPILCVRRYLNFTRTDNAVFAKLYCRTDRFVFSQQLGEKGYEQ
jgi:GntR family transcriptional regulator